MSAFLFFLVKLNLAMAAAIILVALLRRPLRHLFSAPIAYAVWFLVPIAGAASFFQLSPLRDGAKAQPRPRSLTLPASVTRSADSETS